MSVATGSAPQPVPVPPARPPRRKGRTIAIGAAALVALAAVVAAGVSVLVGGATKNAQKVGERFVRAVDRRDGAAAYALTDPAFRAATTQAQLSALTTRLAPLADGGRTVTARSIDVSTATGRIAVLVYRLRATGGGSLYFKTQLRKEADRWQVMNFRSSRSALSADVE